jgi:hypothetical protein
MFSRFYNGTTVCLRCQLTRLQARPAHPHTLKPFLPTTSRRHQSAAVARVEDEDEPVSRGHDQATQENSDPIAKPPKRPWRERKWRPKPTADLGMKALGQPSEVLLLSPRDRKIPVVPTDASEEPAESFYESLTSENQPPTWAQVKSNISQARQQIKVQRGPLDSATWLQLLNIIQKGFTQSQLRRYFIEETSPDGKFALLTYKSKDYLIKTIAKKIWKYELPANLDKSAGDTDTQLPEKVMSIPRGLNSDQRIALLRSPVGHFRNLQNVKLHLSKNRNFLTAPREQAAEALALVKAEISGLHSATTLLDGHKPSPETKAGQAISTDEEHGLVLIESLAQKYGVSAQLKKPNWNRNQIRVTTTAGNASSADRVFHEFQSSLHRGSERSHSMSNITSKQNSSLVPQYVSELSQSYPYPENVFRAYSLPSQKETELVKARQISQKLLSASSALESSEAKFTNFEHVAEFGMALFDSDGSAATASKKEQTPKEEALWPHSQFVHNVPLLPQVLGRYSSKKVSDVSQHVSARLSFIPLEASTSGMSLEVQLVGQELYLGLAQDLEVARMSWTRERSRLNLLCPTSPVDIGLSAHRTTDLLQSDTAQAKALQAAVASYVESLGQSPQGQPQSSVEKVPCPYFPLFLDVKAPSTETSPEPGDQKIDASEDPPKKKPRPKQAKKTTSEPPARKYYLADLSIVSTQSYQLGKPGSPLTLDHTTYIAQNPNANPYDPEQKYTMPSPFRDRQVLSIRDRWPIADDSDMDKKQAKVSKEAHKRRMERFDRLLSTARDVLKEFGKEANKLRVRMEGMK